MGGKKAQIHGYICFQNCHLIQAKRMHKLREPLNLQTILSNLKAVAIFIFP